ncbi:unnamed protein product [Rotaria sp. Silwood2]|nr:unnamed protein product [Rotaria sp. Silwood2]
MNSVAHFNVINVVPDQELLALSNWDMNPVLSSTASITTITSTTTTTDTTTTTTTTTASTTTTTTTSTTTTTTTSTTTTTTTTTTITTTSTTSTTYTTSLTTTTTSTSTTTTQGITQSSAFWNFDNNALESFNSYDGVTSGSPSYTTSLLGHGAAISLTSSSAQYVSVSSKQVLFNSTSFTIEAWIYPISLTTSDHGIFGQCQNTITNMCLHFVSRNLLLYCGFFGNDVSGVTTLTMNQWSHVACVYDITTQTQEVWLNGVLDGTRTSSPYQSSSGMLTIGMTYMPIPNNYYFNGYLDQARYESRAKSATELLYVATLFVHYSFDGGSLLDQGPNGINATSSGSPAAVIGRLNEALQFSSGAYVYVNYPSFYFLGVANYSFTIALWVAPTGSYSNATILFVNATIGWCVNFLTMTSSGNIIANLWNGGPVATRGPILPLNTWNHIGFTYSLTNSVRLYINGTIYSTSGPIFYVASGSFTTVCLAGNKIVHKYVNV